MMQVNVTIKVELSMHLRDVDSKDVCLRMAEVTMLIPVYSAPNLLMYCGGPEYVLESLGKFINRHSIAPVRAQGVNFLETSG